MDHNLQDDHAGITTLYLTTLDVYAGNESPPTTRDRAPGVVESLYLGETATCPGLFLAELNPLAPVCATLGSFAQSAFMSDFPRELLLGPQVSDLPAWA